MDNSSLPRSLLIGTVALMFLLVIGNFYLKNTVPAMSDLETQNQPTIGNPNAPVKMLVVEEPKCPNCKAYNTLTFPKIKKDYIDTGKVQYTTLIVSFSDASFPAAQALLCAFYQDKDNPDDTLFYDFLNKIYRRSDAESSNQVLDEILLETAREANPNINIDELRKCMERQVYYTQIMRNNENAKRLMGGVQATPVIFINGAKSPGISSEIVTQAIETALNPETSKSK